MTNSAALRFRLTVAIAFVAVPLLIGIDECTPLPPEEEPAIDAGSSDDSGEPTCSEPAPGAPNYLCADGTIAGPVCECGGDDCTWVFRTCESACDKPCAEEECGPGPLSPLPYVCERETTGSCVWRLPCDPPLCAAPPESCHYADTTFCSCGMLVCD